jgi:hypothetical protein
VAACADSPTVTPIEDATFTLIPPTATPIPPSATPPPTPDLELVDPSSFLTHTPNEHTFLPLGASQSVQAAVDDLRSTTTVEAIQLLSLKSVEWRDRGLGCSDEQISSVPLSSRGRVSGYRIVLGNNDTIYIYHADDAGTVILCPDAPLFSEEGTPLFVDPATESLSIAAREDLAEMLEVDPETIDVFDVTLVTWTDSSLGCPLPDVDYREIKIIGYRLLLKSGDELYRYHADGLQVQFCPEARETLPPPFDFTNINSETSTPTPVPSATP